MDKERSRNIAGEGRRSKGEEEKVAIAKKQKK
jgi:hypothetical protein